MKKWLFTLLFFSGINVQALPLGNPHEPGMFLQGVFVLKKEPPYSSLWFPGFMNFRAGYYGDFVYNRKLRIDRSDFGVAQNIKRTRIITNAGYLALNFGEKAEVFATLGTSRMTIEANEGAFSSIPSIFSYGSNAILEMTNAFSWSVGGRFFGINWRSWNLGFEFQYFAINPDVNTYISRFNGGNIIYLSNRHTEYRELQGGMGISYQYIVEPADLSLIPYAGVKVARCEFTTNAFTVIDNRGLPFVIYNMESRRSWGFPIGISLVYKDAVELNIETRWLDERALAIKGQLQF